MLKWLIRNRLDAFERSEGYDVAYVRDLLSAHLGAFVAYTLVLMLSSWRRDVPAEVYYAAKITGTIAEDCGPCTQLVVGMALKDGVAPRVVTGILAGEGADEHVALGIRFARAVLAHDPAADDLRDEVKRRWGPRGLVSLAFAVTSSRIYPTLKFALGHARSCQLVLVEGQPVAVRRAVEVRATA